MWKKDRRNLMIKLDKIYISQIKVKLSVIERNGRRYKKYHKEEV
jgi:hypothetical protein